MKTVVSLDIIDKGHLWFLVGAVVNAFGGSTAVWATLFVCGSVFVLVGALMPAASSGDEELERLDRSIDRLRGGK